MPRALFAAVLLVAVATARSAAAGPLWQDTVYGGGPDGQANAVVADGVRACAGGFVATRTSVLGLLRCYDARTGSVLWEDRPGANGDDYEVGRFAADGDRLFATALVVRPASGFDWVVRAHDVRTGELLWEDARDGVGTDEPAALATAGGRVFVTGAAAGPDANTRYVVRAYDAASGALLWQDLSGPVGPADVGFEVAASSGLVFAAGRIGQALHVAAYAQEDGRIVWTYDEEPGFPHVSGLVTANGRLFLAAIAERDLLLRALDPPTGRVLWKDREAAPRSGRGFHPIFDVGLAAEAGLAVVGRRHWDGTAAILARDAATGAPVWRDDDPRVTLGLQIGAGRVFGASGAGELLARAFALDTGRPAWSGTSDPEGSALALARSGSPVFVAGVAGPKAGTFHVAAFDASARAGLRPIVPRGGRLPTKP
ncbi:MAG: hypothetical protein FJ148_22625 [Deltaproteobacteria bacterium]|nr:hypothetical protein [Deltaproteobacteria bacterium]